MLESRSEMYQAGWNDFVAGNDCMFGNDMDYLEGWQDADEMSFELEMESQMELKAELYENEHQYFEV